MLRFGFSLLIAGSHLRQDLSLLTTISLSDIERLQSTGKDVDRQNFVLRDDQRRAWDHVKNLNNARIDFVLDNGKQRFGCYPNLCCFFQLVLRYIYVHSDSILS